MKRILIIITLLNLLNSCKNSKSEIEYMAFEDVVGNPNFISIQKMTKEEMIPVEIPDTYVEDFVIYDSLLLVDTNKENGIIDIISLNTMQSKGRLFSRGNADGEFPVGLDISLQSSIHSRADSLYITTFDFMKGKLYTANITKTIEEGTNEVHPMSISYDFPRPVFWIKAITDSIVYFRASENLNSKQNRHLISTSGELHKKCIYTLNRFEIPTGEDFNLMSTLIAVSPDGKMVVEAPLALNYIDVYSLDEDRGFTICLDEGMTSIDDVLATTKVNRPYMFADVRAYDLGFGILKFDTTDFKHQSGVSAPPNSSIL